MALPHRREPASLDRIRELDELAAARGIAWASVSGALVWALLGYSLVSLAWRG